jgi:hypothetical protein
MQDAQPIPDDVPQKLRENGKKFNLSLYKTQLCNIFETDGTCKFGDVCLYAHGKHELRTAPKHPKYKTELCRSYHSTGECPYGIKCRFIHNFEEASAGNWKQWMTQLDKFREEKLVDPDKWYGSGARHAPQPRLVTTHHVPRTVSRDPRLSIFTEMCAVE